MKHILLLLITFTLSVFSTEPPLVIDEQSDEIYWELPEYLARKSDKIQYVYHRMRDNFKGTLIIPLNRMPEFEGYEEIYAQALTHYIGRESLLTRIIPTLNCLWNDVIFLSPIHPHKHYEEYVKIGYTPHPAKFFKIPIDVLKDKRVTVWKWLSGKKYPDDDPIHDSIYSYTSLNIDHYQERDDLPEDTKEFFRDCFDPNNPSKYPPFNWFRIPHILCQDIIDTSDPRITIIDWAEPISEEADLAIENQAVHL